MASLTFQFFFLGSGSPQTRFSSNVVFIFHKFLNVWKDICLDAKHVAAHLMDHVSFEGSGCLPSQILFHYFVCLCICIFFFIVLPQSVLIMYVPMITFSVDGHHLAFLYDST